MSTDTSMKLMDLPIEMIDKILSYFSYDQISKLRGVNQTFNNICSDKLNKGFAQLEQFHTKCLKAVKSRLPRRESERKHHPLARHSDILMSVETRLSMLSMTYMKYIDAHHCCFIPGKVLDEAFKALRVVNQSIKNTPNTSSNANYLTLPRPHDFLQEYRDISSMAMEHFDDKILPSIREKMRLENPRLYCFKSRAGRPPFLQPVKVPLSQDNAGAIIVGCSRLLPATKQNLETDSGRAVTRTMPSMKLFKMLHHTKAKCNSTHRDVLTLQRTIKSISHKVKCQNVLLKQRLNAQKNMIKHMKRELRDTRNAMNVMSKELNRLKFEQTSSGVSASEERSTDRNNLSVALPTLCIPFIESKASTETKGVKRKRDSSNEITSKDAFCKLLCNK
uniref:F-box domain-containing protein n=1 Tax=Cuerna arida TaxID=1464854 RepID=A0A1B6GK19_9HEMI